MGPETLSPQAPRSRRLEHGFDADVIALARNPLDHDDVWGDPDELTHVWKGGVAVHVAARVMSLAGPGEILTSAVVPMLVEGNHMTFDERGSTTLRGLPGDRAVYALGDRPDP